MAGLGSGGFEPVHGSQDAAERAGAAARESVKWVSEEASRLYGNYSRQSKYFKWRAWILGSYATLAILGVALSRGPSNDIHAHVYPTYDKTDNQLIVSVRNESEDEWTGVHITVNGEYEFERDRLMRDEMITPKLTQFKKIGTGEKAAGAVTPRTLKVKCDQGSYELTLNGS